MDKFYRSRSDKLIIGVCGGIAERFNISSSIVRVLTIILALINMPLAAIIYLLIGILTPMEPYNEDHIRQFQRQPFKIYTNFNQASNKREKAEKVEEE